jgi:hypothetical protein
MDFRSSEYVERYEYVPIYLTTPLATNLGNNQQQRRTGLEFQVNDLSTPIDWYNSYVEISFIVNQLVNGNNYTRSPPNAISPCCGTQSFIKNLSVKANGRQVYSGTRLAIGLFIKNLLLFSKEYANSTARNAFWYIDEKEDTDPTTNQGFKFRNKAIIEGQTVNAKLPLNYFSFFDSLSGKLLPAMKISLIFDMESDSNILWRAGKIAEKKDAEGKVVAAAIDAVPDGRLIITNFTLWLKTVLFNGLGQEKVIKEFFKPCSWLYLSERIERSQQMTQSSGTWTILSQVFKPKHVFIWFSDTIRDNNQERDSMIFDSFNLHTFYLEFSSGNTYPQCHYQISQKSRIYTDVVEYASRNNYFDTSTQLTPWLWEYRYPLYYFDLTYHRSMLDTSAQSITILHKCSCFRRTTSQTRW